jgi:hypothetical protein
LISDLGLCLDIDLTCYQFLYVDDIFFLKAYLSNIEAVMCTLLAFEALSNIKINYAKTELVPMYLNDGEAPQLATMLGYKVS